MPADPQDMTRTMAAHRNSSLWLTAELIRALTPELSRPARGEPVGAETAKRARLERIVRPLKAMLFAPAAGTEIALTRVNPQPTRRHSGF